MAHRLNKKLVLGGVDLVKARFRHADVTSGLLAGQDTLERVINETAYLADAPFEWVGLILRFGLKNEATPHYKAIDKSDGELPLAIEVDAHDLLEADQDEMNRLFAIATLKCLIHAGQKYDLPYERLIDRKKKLEEER